MAVELHHRQVKCWREGVPRVVESDASGGPPGLILTFQVPNSRLGHLARCSRGDELLDYCDSYDRANNELFFNHRYRNMVDILDYYRCGSLHISNDCCPMAFVADLSYWGLPETCLEPCCLKKWVECREQVEWEQAKVEVKEEEWPEGANQLQRRLWNLFEHPHTSLLARIIGIISVSCIFISTIILTLDTLPYFKEHESQIDGEFAAFVIIEAVYMAYFTVEFIIRLITCPSKRDFLRRSMNWIDLLAIVPYFVTVTLKWYGVTEAAIAEDTLSEEEHAGKGVTFINKLLFSKRLGSALLTEHSLEMFSKNDLETNSN